MTQIIYRSENLRQRRLIADGIIEGALSLVMIASTLLLFYFQRFSHSKEKQIHVHQGDRKNTVQGDGKRLKQCESWST